MLRLSPLRVLFSILESFVSALLHANIDREKLTEIHGRDHGLLAVRPKNRFLSIRDFERLRLRGGTSRADAVVARSAGGSEPFGLHAKGCATGGG